MARTPKTITVEIKPDLSRWKATSEALREVGRRWTEFEQTFAGVIETMESTDSTVERFLDEDPEPKPKVTIENYPPGFHDARYDDPLHAVTFADSPAHEPDDDDPTRFGSFGDDTDASVVDESPDDDEGWVGWIAAVCPHGLVTGGAGYSTLDERLRVSEMLGDSRRHIVEYPVGPTIQLCMKCFAGRDL